MEVAYMQMFIGLQIDESTCMASVYFQWNIAGHCNQTLQKRLMSMKDHITIVIVSIIVANLRINVVQSGLLYDHFTIIHLKVTARINIARPTRMTNINISTVSYKQR